MPLVSSFELSLTKGKEAWAAPVVDRAAKTVMFTTGGPQGRAPESPKIGRGANFRCLVCDQVAPEEHVKSEGRAKRMGAQLMAIVAEGERGRIYLPPDAEHIRIAESARPETGPDQDMPDNPRWFSPPGFGMTKFRDLFTPRQLVLLACYSDLVGEARERVFRDAVAAGMPDDATSRIGGGSAARGYADAVATYLGLGVSRLADNTSTLTMWSPGRDQLFHTFTRQALSMVWDYAEASPFSRSAGDLSVTLDSITRVIDALPADSRALGSRSIQSDASRQVDAPSSVVVSTDPPYYDNIGYADLSDYFYVWLRRSLGEVYPDLFSTMLTPKSAELVATPYRFQGSKSKAEQHFESGLGDSFARIREVADPQFPVTVYYAFKQTESDHDAASPGPAIASTGWETMLEGLLRSGLSIGGTWPMRTERVSRMRSMGTNSLASSIVLVCRPRHVDAGITTRKDFVASLKREMPDALRTLQHGNIAPVDLAQASIGPGMAVFSRYAKVLEPDGSAMRIRSALALINQVLGEILSEQEGEFDADTRWAIAWYEQFGLNEADSGRAILLTQAKNTSLDGLKAAGIVDAHRGKTRLLGRTEYTSNWDPASDERVPVWEATQRLVSALLTENEAAAGDLLARLGGLGDTARDLAYRLHQVADQKGWTDEARAYNALVVAWPDLVRRAEQVRRGQPAQASLGLET